MIKISRFTEWNEKRKREKQERLEARAAYQDEYRKAYYNPDIARERGRTAARRDLKAGGRKNKLSGFMDSGIMRGFAAGGAAFNREAERNPPFMGSPGGFAFGMQPQNQSRRRHRKAKHKVKARRSGKNIIIRI